MKTTEPKKCDEIVVRSRGKIVARIVPGDDLHHDARERLRAVRKFCTVGDVVTPTRANWNAEERVKRKR